jgi:DNA-binding CsgD family transcriptional regulator
MVKPTKKIKTNKAAVGKFWEELKRSTLIQSTASSVRLAGVQVTDEEVAQIVGDGMREMVLAKKSNSALSPKQMAVINYLNKHKEASPLEISKHAKVARPTVNQVLNKLLRLNKIERLGQGKATRYRKL